MSLIRSVLKYMKYDITISSINVKLDNIKNKVRTQQYIINKNDK